MQGPASPEGRTPSSAGSGQHPAGDGRPGRAGPGECDIRLTLPARAENVALVRHVVGALAEALHMPEELIEDIRLAVTEACTNVVRHAYAGSDGAIEVSVEPEGAESLTVVVTDHGRGIQPNPDADGPGLGLPLIAALADQLEIEHGPDRGSRVSMQFRCGDRVQAA